MKKLLTLVFFVLFVVSVSAEDAKSTELAARYSYLSCRVDLVQSQTTVLSGYSQNLSVDKLTADLAQLKQFSDAGDAKGFNSGVSSMKEDFKSLNSDVKKARLALLKSNISLLEGSGHLVQLPAPDDKTPDGVEIWVNTTDHTANYCPAETNGRSLDSVGNSQGCIPDDEIIYVCLHRDIVYYVLCRHRVYIQLGYTLAYSRSLQCYVCGEGKGRAEIRGYKFAVANVV